MFFRRTVSFDRLLAGNCRGPVQPTPEFVKSRTRSAPAIPVEYEERAAYLVGGSVQISGDSGVFEAGQLLIFRPGAEVTLDAADSSPTRLMLLGVEQAKEDWKEVRFVPVPDERDFIPLPESGPVVVRYP